MNEIIRIDKSRSIKVDKPNTCPHCQKGIGPIIIKTILDGFYDQAVLYVVFKCPVCQQVFFGKYFIGPFSALSLFNIQDFALHPSEIIGGHGLNKEFSKEINDLSPDFVALYNDAYKAEQYGLLSVVGISYRLAIRTSN